MRANWDENLPPAGILDREEVEARRYNGMNPSFVRRVWAKRRAAEGGRPRPNHPGRVASWTPADIEEVATLLRSGLSSGQIAQKLGVTVGSVSGLVHRNPELKAIGFQTTFAKRLRSAP